MQPLDRGFHGVLKKFYSSECEKWLRNHPGRAITVYQIAAIFIPAFHQVATTGRGVELFKCTGIVPWNPDIFTDADFLASNITEREDPGSISAANASSESVQYSVISSVQAAGVSNETVEIDLPQPGPSRSEPIFLRPLEKSPPPASVSEKLSSTAEARSSLQITSSPLSDLIPFPKSTQNRSSSRKHKKSEVISSSPYKNQLDKENEQQNKPKHEPKAKKTKKVLWKKPNTINKKKIWICVGCAEVYKEPIEEDWIECNTCGGWWHENCSDYNGSGAFTCDMCK